MASNTPAADPSAASAAPEKSKLPLLLAFGAIIAGVAGGVLFTGPIISQKLGMGASAQTAAPNAEHESSSESKAGDEKSTTVVHVIENLVLNPAQSGGTRFLMAAVAIETKNSVVNDAMNKRDAELRDQLLGVLGAKTVEQLADVTQRDALKKELFDEMTKMFGKGSVRRVYFPQFVIQ